jgi:uncharacterized protein (DUF1778 family)
MAAPLKIKRAAAGPAARKASTMQIRIAPGDKAMIERAAGLSGLSLSEFVIDSSRRRAEDTILDRRVFMLDAAAFDAVAAQIRNPPRLSKDAKARLARKPVWAMLPHV